MPTGVKSFFPFCKIFAISWIAISDSDVKITSKPAAKKISDLDFALTPPEKSNLFGKFFYINFAQFNTCVSCCENIDVIPIQS